MRVEPKIALYDRVRIMQTDNMVAFGHANKVFRVTSIQSPPRSSRVLIGHTDEHELMIVSEHSVMKEAAK